MSITYERQWSNYDYSSRKEGMKRKEVGSRREEERE